MKKYLLLSLVLLLACTFTVFASGDKEATTELKSIRVAEQVPGLITPGVWDGQAFSLNSSIYEFLIEINAETGELDPVLALDWNSEDGKRWVITLREGVKFHDGSTFNAEDVKFSIMRTQDPDVGHLKKNDFENVESVEIIDDYTIAINLEKAKPSFIYLFTDYNMMMLSSDYDYASLGESKPMGTGPFIPKQIIPKESALLVKNDNYWDPELPKLDQLLIYFVGDIEASISMLESDRVDVVPFITPIIKQRIDKIDGLKVISPYQEHRFIALVQDMEPFDDNRVRLAFKYAMDPQVIARSVAQMDLNEGVAYNETPILNIQAEYLDIPLTDHPFGKELAQTVKELTAPAGFDIELKGYTRDIYLSQYWLHAPLSITGWGPRADISMLLNYAFRSDAPWNETHTDMQEVDELIDNITAEVDPEIRLGYYHELQEIFHEKGTVINVQVPFLVAINEKVVNYRHPLSMLPQYKYTDIK